MNAGAIELMEITSEDIYIYTTVKGVEREVPFIEAGERDKLEGLDKQLRTIRGPLKAAIVKRIDLEGRIKH